MKKILLFVICLMLTTCLFISALAANATCTLDAPSEVKSGLTTTVNVKLSGTPTLTSVLVQIELSSGLELVSGEWKVDGTLKNFTLDTGYGVLAIADPSTLDGTVFSFVIKGKDISSQQIKVSFTFKNGANELGTTSATKSIKVICATHSFGAYSQSNSQHTRTCGVCGYVEKENHTWDKGTTIQAATCNTDGSKSHTCTKCSATKNEKISATQNHSFGEWSQTKAPDCTTKGQQIRSCSVCNTAEFGDIEALGHTLTNATIIKQPTCADSGIEKGVCTRCNQEAENVIPPEGHLYGEAVISKETTCTICGFVHKEEVTPTLAPEIPEEIETDNQETKSGISPWWLVLSTLASLIIGVIIAPFIPIIKKRSKEKFGERIYEDF